MDFSKNFSNLSLNSYFPNINLNDNILIFLNDKNGNLELKKFKILNKINNDEWKINNPSLKVKKSSYGKYNIFGWILESDINKYYNFKNIEIKKNYRVFISLNIIPNDALVQRWNICKENNGIINSPHITLGRLDISNNNSLLKLLEKKDEIRDALNYHLSGLQSSQSQYKILGKDVPFHIRNLLFTYNDKNELKNIIVSNDCNIECYLARVFYIGNFKFLYELIHSDLEQGTFSDLDFYQSENYEDNFTIHLSLAKFDSINKALSTLEDIYNAHLLPGFEDIFLNPNYLNIQI